MPKLIHNPDGSVRWDYDEPVPERVAEPEALPKPGSKPALIAEAEALGLDTSGSKKDLAARIAEATTEKES